MKGTNGRDFNRGRCSINSGCSHVGTVTRRGQWVTVWVCRCMNEEAHIWSAESYLYCDTLILIRARVMSSAAQYLSVGPPCAPYNQPPHGIHGKPQSDSQHLADTLHKQHNNIQVREHGNSSLNWSWTILSKWLLLMKLIWSVSIGDPKPFLSGGPISPPNNTCFQTRSCVLRIFIETHNISRKVALSKPLASR